MKRFTAVRIATQALTSSDVAVFIGEDICKEAASYRDSPANVFLPDTIDYLISFTIGMAIATDKKIFVFCEDQYFIRNMSELMQAGVSKCRNLFFILLINGRHTSVDVAPLIFDSVNSRHGILYNMGFLVHDYTKHFNNSRNPIKDIREFWKRSRGPLAILLHTDKGTKNLEDIAITKTLCTVSEFIQDETIKSSNYIPPFSLEDLVNT
jgi:hypothetical protein